MAARDEVDRNRSSYPPMFSANCRPGMARESEGRRRHLNYVGGSEGLGAGPPHSEGVRDRRKAIAMPRRSSVCLPALICSSRPSTLQGRVCELSVPGRPRGRHLGDRPKAGDRAPVKLTWRSLEIEIRQRDVPGPSVEEPRDRRGVAQACGVRSPLLAACRDNWAAADTHLGSGANQSALIRWLETLVPPAPRTES